MLPFCTAGRLLRLEGLGTVVNAAAELSIVIPSFNEERRLAPTLEKIAAYIQEKRPNTEVIVVDDGSTDQTAAIAESWKDHIPGLRVVSNGGNRGKGFSVRHGSLEALPHSHEICELEM